MEKIGLDIDGVLCNFIEGFYKFFNEPFTQPQRWEDDLVNRNFKKIANDKWFWLDLKPLVDPKIIKFPIECYITARPIASYISYKWLIDNGFPKAPVFTTGNDAERHNPKTEVISALNLDIFVDDKPQHFYEINKHTNTRCFLMDASWNKSENAGGNRLFSLEELNIYN